MNLLGRILGRGNFSGRDLSYDDAKRMARDPDPKLRERLAARSDLRPEVLYFLAEDHNPRVRRRIAANEATPGQADVLLARDSDGDVRADLALKIGRLAPDLPPGKMDQLQRLTLEALRILADDALPRVRQILAEEIKHLDNLPREVARKLARDVELTVAAPILEFSPLLDDRDLLEIITSAPIQGALAAISRRRNVTEPVTDAIAETDDVDAIAALLANPSAQIREQTLDRLIDRAPDHQPWHQPMVRRPHLSARAITRLSRFVSDSLLETLRARHKLDAKFTALVSERMRERFGAAVDDDTGDDRTADHREAPAPTPIEATALADRTAKIAAKAAPAEAKAAPAEAIAAEDRAMRALRQIGEAEAHHRAGKIDDAMIVSRLGDDDRDFLVQALALSARVAPGVVRRVLQSRSGKGVTALAWTAGLTMRTALELQTKVMRVPRSGILYARNGVDFPLEPEEMTWRLGMFAE